MFSAQDMDDTFANILQRNAGALARWSVGIPATTVSQDAAKDSLRNMNLGVSFGEEVTRWKVLGVARTVIDLLGLSSVNRAIFEASNPLEALRRYSELRILVIIWNLGLLEGNAACINPTFRRMMDVDVYPLLKQVWNGIGRLRSMRELAGSLAGTVQRHLRYVSLEHARHWEEGAFEITLAGVVDEAGSATEEDSLVSGTRWHGMLQRSLFAGVFAHWFETTNPTPTAGLDSAVDYLRHLGRAVTSLELARIAAFAGFDFTVPELMAGGFCPDLALVPGSIHGDVGQATMCPLWRRFHAGRLGRAMHPLPKIHSLRDQYTLDRSAKGVRSWILSAGRSVDKFLLHYLEDGRGYSGAPRRGTGEIRVQKDYLAMAYWLIVQGSLPTAGAFPNSQFVQRAGADNRGQRLDMLERLYMQGQLRTDELACVCNQIYWLCVLEQTIRNLGWWGDFPRGSLEPCLANRQSVCIAFHELLHLQDQVRLVKRHFAGLRRQIQENVAGSTISLAPRYLNNILGV